MKSKRSRIIVTVILVIVLLGGAGALIMKKKAKLAKAPRYGLSPTLVHVATAKKGDLDIGVTFLSVVEPFNKADVSSRVSAAVAKVAVDEGDLVKAGDVLVELDAKDIMENIASISARIKQAEAELSANNATAAALEKSAAFWEREAQRDMTLAKDGAIPESNGEQTATKADEVKGQRDAALRKSDALAATIRSLKKAKAQAEAQLAYYKLRAPFDGVVTFRLVDPGDLAAPGKPLVTVEDRHIMMLVFDIPQADLDRVREGVPVSFTIGEERRHATVSHIYPALTTARMARAEVYIEGPEKDALTIGAYVPATVVQSRLSNVVILPKECLVEHKDENPYVYLVEDGHIAIRTVKIAGDNGNLAAVEGVKPGEKAVVNTFLGWATLAEGMPVEVAK